MDSAGAALCGVSYHNGPCCALRRNIAVMARLSAVTWLMRLDAVKIKTLFKDFYYGNIGFDYLIDWFVECLNNIHKYCLFCLQHVF
jgi:hypothetical protein